MTLRGTACHLPVLSLMPPSSSGECSGWRQCHLTPGQRLSLYLLKSPGGKLTQPFLSQINCFPWQWWKGEWSHARKKKGVGRRFLCLPYRSVHRSSPVQGISTSEMRRPQEATQSFLLNFVFVNKSCKHKKERQTLLLSESHLTFNIYNTFRCCSPSHWALLRGSFCLHRPFSF